MYFQVGLRRWVWAWGVVALSTQIGTAGLSVSLTPSTPAAPVGTSIHFTALALVTNPDGSSPDGGGGPFWYRYRVRKIGSDHRIIRDFGIFSSLDWTTDSEGYYEIEVAARNPNGSDVAYNSVIIQWTAIASPGNSPVVTPTTNSLLFLYSASACPLGQRMRVEFQGPEQVMQSTPFKDCKPGATMNFYIAGLRADTNYTAHHRLDTGKDFVIGPDVPFTTGDLPQGISQNAVVVPPNGGTTQPILLDGPLFSMPVAHDLLGNVVWYAPPGDYTTTRPEAGGKFWGISENFGNDATRQSIRLYDLTGTTILETNAARVNEQLAALGKRQISAFHHEVRTLPDGRIAAMASVEQILTDVQGPGDVDVIGDMIIVLDQNLNVVWTWDTFDNLDPHRRAVLNEQCNRDATCPPFMLANDANDWTHGNTIAQTFDGNLLYSSRHQDWVIKIAYNNGEGDGHVIWKLGKDGDFNFVSSDSFPWFSHQHDTDFDPDDPTRLLVFDNGNTRVVTQAQGASRGQVLQLDESNRTATVVVNLDPGLFAIALGSAQKLRNGNYHFDFGYVQAPSGPQAFSIESDATGTVQYNAQANVPLYRSFRMSDMYTPK
jgi:hypothetical protein